MHLTNRVSQKTTRWPSAKAHGFSGALGVDAYMNIVIEIIKSFISGIFAGWANDEIKRNNYKGAKWRVLKSIKYAPNDYSLVMAHTVSAKVNFLLTEYLEANKSFNIVSELLIKNPDYEEFPELTDVIKEIEKLFNRRVK